MRIEERIVNNIKYLYPYFLIFFLTKQLPSSMSSCCVQLDSGEDPVTADIAANDLLISYILLKNTKGLICLVLMCIFHMQFTFLIYVREKLFQNN